MNKLSSDIPSQEQILKDRQKGIGWYVLNVATLIFTIQEDRLKILLEKRTASPEERKWVILGKFLDYGKTLEETAQSKLQEIFGSTRAYLEQLYLYGDPDKKIGKKVLTIIYLLLVPNGKIKESNLQWFPVQKLPVMAFDNKEIIKYGCQRLQNKATNTTIVAGFLPKKFRLSELQKAYEIVLEKSLNKRNFRTKILSLGILKKTGEMEKKGAHRPAMLYQFKKEGISLI
ncbi:NUDIX domain-containing protein [Patescibacteria group bacterium]|nr:NUDIX domain-containing protein [Patescibacteria group bacterium]